MASNQTELEGSGFLFNLIHYLWIPDYFTSTIPKINMPHTIQFKRSQPTFWYFTIDGTLLRKQKEKRNKQEIRKIFIQNSNKEICAVWITEKSYFQLFFKYLDSQIEFQYLSPKQLDAFLNVNDDSLTGVLQKFVYPQGDQNFVIKVFWSDELNFFNMITNKNNLYHRDIDIYQRVVTFEQIVGPFENSTVKGQILPNQLLQQCQNIYLHIMNMSGEKKQIKSMELYFKINKKKEIMFLFCSQLKLKNLAMMKEIRKDDNEEQFNEKAKNEKTYQMEYKLPDNISSLMLNMRKQGNIAVDELCISCDGHRNIKDLTQIRIKEIVEGWIVDHWEQEDAQSQKNLIEKIIEKKMKKSMKRFQMEEKKLKGNQNYKQQLPMNLQLKISAKYQIPPLIKKLYPHMTQMDLQNELNNDFFLSQVINICSDCYLKKMKKCRPNESQSALSYMIKSQDKNSKQIELFPQLEKRQLKEKLKQYEEQQYQEKQKKTERKKVSKTDLLFRFKNKSLNLDFLSREVIDRQGNNQVVEVKEEQNGIKEHKKSTSQSQLQRMFKMYTPKGNEEKRKVNSINSPFPSTTTSALHSRMTSNCFMSCNNVNNQKQIEE